jgi:hypothetical protein
MVAQQHGPPVMASGLGMQVDGVLDNHTTTTPGRISGSCEGRADTQTQGAWPVALGYRVSTYLLPLQLL